MEASLKTNGFACCHKVFSDVIPREVSQDMVVSDTMPDIAEIVTAEGTPLIRSKDISDGRVRLEANIPVRVAYLPEDGGNLRFLDLSLPVSVSDENPAVKDGCKCTVGLLLKALDARMLNSRKISVCALLEIRLDCYQEGETLFATADPDGGDCIHVLEREQEISEVCCVTEKTFVLTDEYILPQGATPAAELIGESVSFRIEEMKSVGSKLILKGSACSRVLYCSEEGRMDTTEYTTAFSQIADTDCNTENPTALADLLLSGMYYDVEPGFDGRTIKMELHVVAQIQLLRTEKVRYIADAYSNTYELELIREQWEGKRLGRECQLRDTIRTQLELEMPVAEVLSCHAEVLSAVQQGSAVSVNVLARLCCRDENGKTFVFRKTIPGEISTDPGEQESYLICAAATGEVFAAPSGSGIELRIALEIGTLILQRSDFVCVSGIRYDDAQMLDLSKTPSLVIMKVSSSDCLWQIARENLSTVEAIKAANDLESAGETWEKLLLIPRTY